MIYALEDAHTVVAWMTLIEQSIGVIDALIVRQVLGDRRSYEDVAVLRGMPGEKSTRYFARRFRDALEYLSDDWAKGGIGGLLTMGID
jgi:hypothetical protein